VERGLADPQRLGSGLINVGVAERPEYVAPKLIGSSGKQP
jgi:hypothetical protein